jgi:hypothetical protein
VKKILFIVALNCLIFLSCRKTPVIVNLPIIGRWTQVETLADPGDGSGKWMTVSMTDYYFIKFEPGNSVESNISRGSGNVSKYKIVTDSTLYLIYAKSDTVSYFYKIKGNILTLEGGCYERCGMKFEKDR